MSVAAAELPEMARLRDAGGAAGELLARVRRSLRQTAFLNVPTFAGYLAFGYLLVGLLYRTGAFQRQATWLVYLVLCGYTLGLLATTSSRLLQNTFYALGDTRSPARIAALRVAVSAALGVPLMLALDRLPVSALVGGEGAGGTLFLGAVGLALASGVGAWLELALLRRALARRLPGPFLPWKEVGRMVLLAAAAALPAALLWRFLPPFHVTVRALAVVGCYGAVYLLLARFAAPEELAIWTGRFGRRLRKKSP
jgi:putative peptidoglycan lipid II flippase